MKTLVLSLVPLLFVANSCDQSAKKEKEEASQPNFLIFFIDDLRPELACYGADQIHSPNIDKLASQGVQFDKAYCNVPVCGASRASLLTGLRPSPTRFLGYSTRADEDAPGHLSMPMHFKNNGYYTVSYGKIFHHEDDSEDSWSEPIWKAPPSFKDSWRDYVTEDFIKNFSENADYRPSYEIAENLPDSAYIDGKTANAAVRKLRKLKEQDQPFMFWVGFVKPHLPFNAPSKYWDMYDRNEILLAENPEKSESAPEQSIHNFGELRNYSDIPAEGALSDEKVRELRHGYYACVSYTDALIGQVMAELERLELDDNTIVAVFGDHGWNLGEHGLWCKHSNYNTSLHVPLIIKVPGKTNGKNAEGLVEFVDLYPTFTELAGLEIPEHVDGKSIVPLIENPDLKWDDPVYPRYVLGNSIVTDHLIYTEFMQSLKDCTIVANMLYDHLNDPDENINISSEADYAPQVDSLSVMMNKVHLGFVE